MKIEIFHTGKSVLSRCKMENEILATSFDLLEAMLNCPTQTIVLDKEALNPYGHMRMDDHMERLREI